MNERDLIKEYLHALENPENSGLNLQTRKWGRGRFDPHSFQDGLDDRNTFVKKYLSENKTDSIPEEDALKLQDEYLKELDAIWNRRTKGRNISPYKKMMAYGLMWQKYGPNLWNNKGDGLFDAFWNGTDEDFSNAIIKFYGSNDRGRRHSEFWKKQKPQKKAIVHPHPIKIVEQPDATRVNKPQVFPTIPYTGKNGNSVYDIPFLKGSLSIKKQGGTIYKFKNKLIVKTK